MILTILSSFLATHLNLINLSVSYKVVHPSHSLGCTRFDPQESLPPAEDALHKHVPKPME